jgi:hypothetical protein
MSLIELVLFALFLAAVGSIGWVIMVLATAVIPGFLLSVLT